MIAHYAMGNQDYHKNYGAIRTKQTSSLPFAITSLGDYICDNKYFVNRKGLESCLILYTLDGEGIVRYNNCEFTVKPGQVMILDCRRYHYYATKGENWHFLWIHYVGKCAYDYEAIFNAGGAAPFVMDGRCRFQECFESLTQHVVDFHLQGELEISLILQKLLTELVGLKRTGGFSEKYERYQSELEQSISFLQEPFSENLSVDQLARDCNLSKYYYIKVFRAYTGQTPYDYLIHLRLQKAQAMLVETTETVEEIAAKVGFSEGKNFIACFKKRVGITPLQFRKQATIFA